MPISLLRKAPPKPPPEPVPSLAQLSLPDLTTPLIDTAAWGAQAVTPLGPSNNGNTPPAAPNPRNTLQPGQLKGLSANPARASMPPGFGRPSGAAPPPLPLSPRGRAPSLVRDPSGRNPDFHRPFSPEVVAAPLPPKARPRKNGRKGAALTVIVAGTTGAGKTSFIEALTSVLDPATHRLGGRTAPTTAIVRHEVVAADERRALVLLDTPGLPTTTTRAKALSSLLGMIEDRLGRLLDEERKVVRRKSDGGEMVHLVIYLIDARTILCPAPPVEVDWDMVAEPSPTKAPDTRPESDLEPDHTELEARLGVDDIEAIRRFSIRANVMPVLTHADALTTIQLNACRDAVKQDLAAVFGREPLGAYGVLSAGLDLEADEDDEENSEPPTSAGVTSPLDANKDLPFAVFSPEPGPGFTRTFRWGRADAADAAHSDFPAVRDAVVNAAEWLRMSTREVVYERFRTERLLTARARYSRQG
ncbi:hypothetical protein Q8F55_001989 [Vanrija albida]|uniref:Septin-type G domain-containing protein n=1 Tax=Vanrija albida TaxID=181172 RepID=A0ABR3Q8S9_9TREE